jgi:hypothetical protein
MKLWTESMLWDEQIDLSSGLGYNDNVFLSAFNPRGSAFFHQRPGSDGSAAAVGRLADRGWRRRR